MVRKFVFEFNLDSAVQDDKAMQDFESESLLMGADHSQKVKAAPIKSGYGSKDCVTVSSSTAVSRFIAIKRKPAIERKEKIRSVRQRDHHRLSARLPPRQGRRRKPVDAFPQLRVRAGLPLKAERRPLPRFRGPPGQHLQQRAKFHRPLHPLLGGRGHGALDCQRLRLGRRGEEGRN